MKTERHTHIENARVAIDWLEEILDNLEKENVAFRWEVGKLHEIIQGKDKLINKLETQQNQGNLGENEQKSSLEENNKKEQRNQKTPTIKQNNKKYSVLAKI